MKKKQIIHYLTRDQPNDTKEYLAIRWVSSIVEGSYTKRYHNTIGLLAGLSPCALHLLNFIVEIMNKENVIYNTTELKKDFNKVIFKATKKQYSVTAINRAFNEMSSKKILIKISTVRSMYRVNPKYFFNGNEANRIKEIIIDFEQKDIEIFLRYRALTFDEDMAMKNMKRKKKGKL